MCLALVTRICKPIIKEERYAWKVFSTWQNDLNLEYQTIQGSSTVKRGVWLKAEKPEVTLFAEDEAYPYGFHCFTTREAARHWRIGGAVVRVRVRRIKAFGKQAGHTALIAGEMFVPR